LVTQLGIVKTTIALVGGALTSSAFFVISKIDVL